MQWTMEEFLKRQADTGLHTNLLGKLQAISEVEVVWMQKATGSKLPGYKVYLKGKRVLWIMVPSKETSFYPTDIYVDWQLLSGNLMSTWNGLWKDDVSNPDNLAGSFVKEGLAGIGVDSAIARLKKLIAIA